MYVFFFLEFVLGWLGFDDADATEYIDHFCKIDDSVDGIWCSFVLSFDVIVVVLWSGVSEYVQVREREMSGIWQG